MKRWIHASSNYTSMINDKGENFQDYLNRTRYEGFDPSGLTDDEYYELEDEFYGVEKFGRKEFDEWWMTLSRDDMETVTDIIEEMDLPFKEADWPESAFLEVKQEFEAM